jgi:hypothetical protein
VRACGVCVSVVCVRVWCVCACGVCARVVCVWCVCACGVCACGVCARVVCACVWCLCVRVCLCTSAVPPSQYNIPDSRTDTFCTSSCTHITSPAQWTAPLLLKPQTQHELCLSQVSPVWLTSYTQTVGTWRYPGTVAFRIS